jgi:hypothetical protein
LRGEERGHPLWGLLCMVWYHKLQVIYLLRLNLILILSLLLIS